MSEVPASSKSMPAISVVMPALNEEAALDDAITGTLKAFDELLLHGEVVVINDGSTDRTRAITEAIMAREPSRVRLVNHDTPQGIGAAFWDGVTHARGDAVCMLPGDNENDPVETLRYVPLLQHVDLVVPFAFNREVRTRTRKILSFFFRLIVNLTFGMNFNYTNGTVICRRALLQRYRFHDRGFFFTTEILVRLTRAGYLFAEVPYRLNLRSHGRSKAVTWRAFKGVVKGFLRLVHSTYFGSADQEASASFPEGTKTHHRRSNTERLAADLLPQQAAATETTQEALSHDHHYAQHHS